MSFLKNKFRLRKRSIITKVTLWYSFFIMLLTSIIMIGAFFVSIRISENSGAREFEETAVEMAQNIKEEFETYDDGNYFAIYDQNGKLIEGSFPKGFDTELDRQKDQGPHGLHQKTDDGLYMVMDIPIKGSDQWLRAMHPKHQINEDLVTMLLVLLIGLPAMMILVLIGGYFILKNAFKPVTAITTTAQEISKEADYSKRVDAEDKGDELTSLAEVINTMLGSIERSFKREKQLTNDVSHELRTPISVILSESEFGENYASDLDEAKDSFGIIRRQALSMRDIVEQVLTLARSEKAQEIETERLNLSELLNPMLADRQQLFKDKGIKLEGFVTPDLYIQADKVMVSRMIDNLLSNAMKFTTDDVVVSLNRRGDQIVLGVADNGPGIPQEEQEKIWNRFYQMDQARHRTKESGIGIGLTMVKRVADLHGADLKLQSVVDKGSLFEVSFKEDKSQE